MSDTTTQKPGDPKADEHGKPRGDGKVNDNAQPENKSGELDERLDEALEETFPSSDPVSVKITK
ncbi:hypothetical protein [Methylobacterium gnaphalii]|uniref:Uncharacterized protein n=1 Tax=Methylobacterium gnaphalii TaxID=1010610 RepID=A0A512JET7_9HYPH|nr:hypothetical protein [Methylobacterium gnaphalii]GEP08449.1 hypothetical protein MGN01_02940 [Methylobacterium gnaphalii]GJD68839.1 hypothetical protein MMMDOFMJ_1764 [Methylobacterium gnaphalii]GLS47363.1 hypothetical protein GCM10007885_02070 [Methylobacterium gnaphalii]